MISPYLPYTDLLEKNAMIWTRFFLQFKKNPNIFQKTKYPALSPDSHYLRYSENSSLYRVPVTWLKQHMNWRGKREYWQNQQLKVEEEFQMKQSILSINTTKVMMYSVFYQVKSFLLIKVDNARVHKKRRLLLLNWNELYTTFKRDSPKLKIGITPLQLFEWCSMHLTGLGFFYISKGEIEQSSLYLNAKWSISAFSF